MGFAVHFWAKRKRKITKTKKNVILFPVSLCLPLHQTNGMEGESRELERVSVEFNLCGRL